MNFAVLQRISIWVQCTDRAVFSCVGGCM